MTRSLKLIEQLEKIPVTDPRGYTNAGHRATLNKLLREMHNRIEALEKERAGRLAGYPGYD